MTRLVLLPGMDGTGRLFDPFVAAINGRVATSVVRYPENLSSYQALTDLARAALPVGEPYILLGESFSGPIALTLAAERPPGLKGLVLCATFARCPSAWLARMGPVLGLMPQLLPPLALMRPLLCNGKHTTPGTFTALRGAVDRISPAVMLARLRQIAAVDVSAALRQISVPMLYLRAAQDRLVSAQSFEHMRRLNPDIQLSTFEAPHLLLQTVPQAAAVAVCQFMGTADEGLRRT